MHNPNTSLLATTYQEDERSGKPATSRATWTWLFQQSRKRFSSAQCSWNDSKHWCILRSPPGKEIAPGAVAKWMVKISEYSMTMCTSNICIIFGQDGTIGDYPVYVEPADPPDPCALAVKKKWDIRYTAWFNNTEQLEQDKKKLYGYMAGQMSESSKNRTKETTVGNEASIEKEPRKLLQAILATHLGDSRLGADHHLFNIEQAYHALVMGPNEPLINYHEIHSVGNRASLCKS